jgi:hypothetical protein
MANGEHGRPRIIESPERFDELVDEYFKMPGEEKQVFVRGEPVKVKFHTLTGLILHLGFSHKQSFYDYADYDGFSDSVKRARTMIEHEYEMLAQTGNSGGIFGLKNFGWTDRQDINLKTEENAGLIMSALGKMTDMSPEEESRFDEGVNTDE